MPKKPTTIPPSRRPKHETVQPDFVPGWLQALDGRRTLSIQIRARFEEICTDLGGVERMSYIERSLVEHALWVEYWVAQQERLIAEGRGDEVDTGRWGYMLDRLKGAYKMLGLQRKARADPAEAARKRFGLVK